MRVTVQGLRRWTVYAGALLLAVVVGFFVYGRARFRHIEKDLPGRLGANIQQTATGFSYSQSSRGHTLFTLKASKLVQLRAGHALLHGVDITLYGPPGSGRSDRIYGSDFDYDQNAGVATSRGEVDIDIEGIGSPGGRQAAQHADDGSGAAGSVGSAASASDGSGAAAWDGSAASASDGNTIRVRTSGLTFVQKTGDASTPNHVEFQLPRAAGSSMGASYNSQSGVLVLESQVHITTSNNGNSAVVDAQHARLLRDTMQAFLDGASMEYQSGKGSSDHATVWFRRDGTAEKIDAQGQVRMDSDSGATVDAETAEFLLDAQSQPTRADLGGGVRFATAGETEAMRGSAIEGTLLFTADPHDPSHTALHHAEFRRQVSFTQQIKGLGRDAKGRSQKQLQAQRVDIEFVPGAQGRAGKDSRSAPVEARRAVAEGAPVLTTMQAPSKGPQQTTRISGDELVATLGAGNALERLDAAGHTSIDDRSGNGAEESSRGDVLHAIFRETAGTVGGARKHGSGRARGKEQTNSGETSLESAVQDGNVVLTETPAKKAGEKGAPSTLTAWAQHAEYHAADQVLHLTGNPRMTDSESLQLSAEAIDYHRDSQDAFATGSVKTTYTQAAKGGAGSGAPNMGGSGPVHVIAERAEMHHATSRSVFYGSAQEPARMWQGSDSLLAPVITIDRARNRLEAGGEGAGGEPRVHANFVSESGGHRQAGMVRVTSQTLVYADSERRADFRGRVTAQQGNELIHCDDALVFLKPAAEKAGGAKKAQEGPSSKIDRMIATGQVVFTEPGRSGRGEKLVYTADSGVYELTGTPSAPPRMTDRVHGMTTGEALLFNSQNDSVEVSGGKSSAVTDTRAPK